MFLVIIASLFCFVNAQVYCRYQQGSDIIYYSSNSCGSPSTTTSSTLNDLGNYDKVVIKVKNISHSFSFGSTTTPFIGNGVDIVVEQDMGNFYANFKFDYLQNGFPLSINSSFPINGLNFNFLIGNSPTRIYGDVTCLKIGLAEDKNYYLPRQRTFFGNAFNSTTKPHLSFSSYYGYFYGISSYGDKFPSTSSDVLKVSCGGMFRYYYFCNFPVDSIYATCNKTFTENDDDDFDSFKVTSVLTSSVQLNIYLSLSNIIVASTTNTKHNIYTHPNMFFKYSHSKNILIVVYGTNERKGKIQITFNINEKNEPSSTSIMEVQNLDKTLSTYIIATSKPITNFVVNTFIETEVIKSQLMLFGLGNQVVLTNYPLCETVFKHQYYERCYTCKNGSYSQYSTCSDEKIMCSKTLQSKCISCNYGYYLYNGMCSPTSSSISNCLNSASNSYCSECAEGYYLKEGICHLKDVNCMKYEGNICLKCQFGYQLLNNKCEKGIDSHCYYEKYQCIECSDGYTLNGNSCVLKENKNGINEIIYCEDGYYIENGTCNDCINSIYCESKTKVICLEGYYNENNTCISKTCEIKDSNGKCGMEIDNCKDNLILNG